MVAKAASGVRIEADLSEMSGLMLSNSLVRIVMAVVLATWSPVWCQCVLSTTVAGQPHGAQVDQSEPCCDAIEPAPVIIECCTDVPQPQIACCSEGEHRAGDGACACPCCDQMLVWITAKRSASEAAEDGPANAWPAVHLTDIFSPTAEVPEGTGAAPSPPRVASLQQSLVAKHCLLLI